ncbi:MAG: NDMA-dependent alcohol dehydrogenase, partial [Microthrixaceae bacterium]|nr:NDMA-dependent alcohol dehydrogenase [Microthrixaceae bacterium]
MKTRAAVLWGVGEEWKIEELTLDEPRGREVLVKTKAAGMCHSDEHAVTGDLPLPHFPTIGGHEGSGIVEAVGPDVTTVAVGDHVSMSFIPSCGRCPSCVRGQSNLCDEGAKLFNLGMMGDDRVAHHIGDQPAARFAQLGTFAEHMLLSEDSVVKVAEDLPFPQVALVSCGVSTGYNSVVERAEVKAGDTVVVIGVGGVGMNSVQGASIAGAKRVVAIDPEEFKREQAMEFGATHTYASVEEATAALSEMTWGTMANATIITVGSVTGDMIEPAMNLTGKGGTVVLTSLGSMFDEDVTLNMFMLAMMNKQIKGTVFGSANPRDQIPNLLGMYQAGRLKLDEL